MKLLNPKTIKDDRSETAEQAIKRASKLNKEESRLAIMINDARDKAKETIKEINKELSDYKEQIIIKTARLTQEIDALEDKRKELLKPIDNIRLEAEGYLKETKKRLKKVDAEIIINSNISKKNDSLKTILENKEKVLDNREADIVKKESENKKKEKDLEQSENVLKINWSKYIIEVEKLNDREIKIIQQEDALKIEKQAIAERKISQDKRQAELDSIKKGLNSEREAIGQAKKHLGIK